MFSHNTIQIQHCCSLCISNNSGDQCFTTGSGQYIVEEIGNRLTPSIEGVDAPGIVVLLNTPFQKDGVVYAFQAYFRLLETVAFQIWRPTSSNSSVSGAFSLVAEITAKPSTQTEPVSDLVVFSINRSINQNFIDLLGMKQI